MWFCSAKSKNVCEQLRENPAVEICAVKPDATTLRLTGKIVLKDDRAIKERILSERCPLKNIYGNADNPDFTTFYIDHGACLISDFSGNPPRAGSF